MDSLEISPQCKEIYKESDLVNKLKAGDLVHVSVGSKDKGLMVFYKNSGEYYTFIKRSYDRKGVINLSTSATEMKFNGRINIISSKWCLDFEISSNSKEYEQKDKMLLFVGM